VAESREEADLQRAAFIAEFDKAERDASDAMQREIGEFEKKIKDMEAQGDADPQAAMQAIQQLASKQRLAQRLDTKIEQLKRTRDADVEAVERRLGGHGPLGSRIRQKWLAVRPAADPAAGRGVSPSTSAAAPTSAEGVAKSRLR